MPDATILPFPSRRPMVEERRGRGVPVIQAIPGAVVVLLGLGDGTEVELYFSPEGMEQFCEAALRCAQSAREAEAEMRLEKSDG